MMTSLHGIFLAFEGGEGAGKSSLIQKISKELEGRKVRVLVTREPGGTHLGEKLREILKNPDGAPICAEAEFLLFAASRVQHLQEVICPALEKKTWVLCDRFMDSSWVYQGYVKKVSTSFIEEVHREIVRSTLPDVTFVFDLDPTVGLQRAERRDSGMKDRFEEEGVEFHRRVREGYQLLMKKHSEGRVLIDASQNIEFNFRKIMKILEENYLP